MQSSIRTDRPLACRCESTRQLKCGPIWLIYAMWLCAVAAQSASATELVRFYGICDGSAGVETSAGNLLIAYDELNYLFEFSPSGGHYLRQIKLSDSLRLPDQSEMDLEAASSDDKFDWWLGSHARDGEGKHAANRQILFRTNRSNPTTVVGNGIDLLDAGLDIVFSRDTKKRKPKKGGINFEGLTVTPGGKLLIGVRSPLSSGKQGDALLLEIADPYSDVTLDIEKHVVDLKGYGIRGLTAFRAGYLLIAGAPVSGGDSILYFWKPRHVPVELPLLDSRLNAEALVPVRDGILVLSDDGNKKRADESAKDGDRRCDKIRRKNPAGHNHSSVYFRAQHLSIAVIEQALAQAR